MCTWEECYFWMKCSVGIYQVHLIQPGSFGHTFLIYFLSGWSVHWCKWCIKVLYYYCITVNFFLYVMSLNTCFVCLGVPILGVYMFMNVVSLSFAIDFILKSILSDISIAPPVFFHFYLHRLSFSILSLSTFACLQL